MLCTLCKKPPLHVTTSLRNSPLNSWVTPMEIKLSIHPSFLNTIIITSSYTAHFTIRHWANITSLGQYHVIGPISHHVANNSALIFLSFLGSKQPWAAMALHKLFKTHDQHLPSQVPIYTSGWREANYSKISCSRTQVSRPGFNHSPDDLITRTYIWLINC